MDVITPKVGVDAAIISIRDEVLVLKRQDDHLWCLPGGWIEPGENPAQAAVREVREETGLEVEASGYIAISCKGPELALRLHYQINILTLMKPLPLSASIHLSAEHSAYQWINFDADIAWHPGHYKQFQRIHSFIKSDRSSILKVMDVWGSP